MCILSYAPGQKAYKLYDIHNNKAIISRDVIFHESIFPYKSSNPTPDTSSVPIPKPIPGILIFLLNHLSWLRDFVHTSSDHVSSNLASSSSDFQAALSTVQEPRTYNQAKGCVEWELAMQKQLSALEQNETLEVVDLPKRKRAIGSKWVYKVKLNPDGSVERYKARLVSKRYDQIEVCKLKRSLYGLKRASRQWNQELTMKLVQYNFSQSPHDHCLFTKATPTAGTSVTQHKYIRDIITDAGHEDCRPTSTPLPLGLKLTSHAQPTLDDPEPYRRLETKKQSTVSRSTAEAEYCSLGATVCELQWISYLLQDLPVKTPTPILLFCDNQVAFHIVANPIFHERTKHLEIDCHLVLDKFKSGFILPSHIAGKMQLADLFTKLLPGPLFASFLLKLGLVSNTHGGGGGGGADEISKELNYSFCLCS
ncbi:UNVERIFIED_CONTAM: Retrovirus-related Pol polyprotein from transposon RE1 [Sesamum latifolium]|uniref:Retrovirus-related Pol polyprotein from transposon RE1 n=1 Tax=Sesamum latifolium TaxID=2727402 RepID=A0AAW2XMF8_9LAMI